jgi:hypothetical protein
VRTQSLGNAGRLRQNLPFSSAIDDSRSMRLSDQPKMSHRKLKPLPWGKYIGEDFFKKKRISEKNYETKSQSSIR